MTTRTRTFLAICSIFSLTFSFGQSTTTPGEDLELTEENLKRLFSESDACCPEQLSVWTACYHTDVAYATSDTIKLYNDMYFYLTTSCCYETSWTFTKSNTFNLLETKVCQEPPQSLLNFDNYDLKIKFDKKDDHLILSVYKQKKLKDQFLLLSLEHHEKKNGKHGYQLTMVRMK